MVGQVDEIPCCQFSSRTRSHHIIVATALEVCEQRDRKGLSARARAGIVKEFTGISDPYEIPTDAELTIDTAAIEPDQAAELILRYLEREGFLEPVASASV